MRTEKIVVLIILLSLVGRLFHVPGSAMFFVLSMSALILTYFPFGFYFFKDKEANVQNLVVSIATGLWFSIILCAILFRFMYWVGGFPMGRIAAFVSPIIVAVLFYLRNQESKDLTVYYNRMLVRSIVLAFIAVPLYFTKGTDLLKVQHWNQPEILRARILYFEHPGEVYYQQRYYEVRDSMENVHQPAK